jgi:hypothetical protein
MVRHNLRRSTPRAPGSQVGSTHIRSSAPPSIAGRAGLSPRSLEPLSLFRQWLGRWQSPRDDYAVLDVDPVAVSLDSESVGARLVSGVGASKRRTPAHLVFARLRTWPWQLEVTRHRPPVSRRRNRANVADCGTRSTALISGRPRISKCLREVAHQFGGVDLECGGDLQDVEKAWVHLPAFEVPDVGSVETRGVSQILLAQTRSDPEGSNSTTKLLSLSDGPPMLFHQIDATAAALDTSTPNI